MTCGFPTVREEVTRTVKLARGVGGKSFQDLEKHEEQQLLGHHQELSAEELVELLQSTEIDEESDEEPERCPQLTATS